MIDALHLCKVVGVAASGFYAWLRRVPSRRQADDQRVKEKVKQIFQASRQTYGSPRIHAEWQEAGLRISRKRVARLMRESGIVALVRRRWVMAMDYPNPIHWDVESVREANMEDPHRKIYNGGPAVARA